MSCSHVVSLRNGKSFKYRSISHQEFSTHDHTNLQFAGENDASKHFSVHQTIFFYTVQEYYGEVALHIAIIKRNASMVEWLLGDEANQAYRHQQLTAAASGTFFRL